MAFHPFGDFHCKVDAIRAGCSQSVKAAIAGHQDDVARTSSPSIHGVDIDVGSTDAAQTPLGHRAASSCNKSTRSGLDANPGKVLSLSHTHNFAMRPCHTHTTLSHTTFTHVTTLSHTTLENHRSSTVSFVFPAFSVPLQPVCVIFGKS